jgi:ABC-type dipeptide/oligopeptide/nickel transport system ATPase component
MNPPTGCHFRTRCQHAMEICAAEKPVATEVGGLTVRCHLMDPSLQSAVMAESVSDPA